MNGNEKSIEQVFTPIDKTILEIIRSDAKEAILIIADSGMHPDEEMEIGLKTVRRLQFKAKAAITQKTEQSLMEKALIRLKELFKENISLSNDILITLLRQKAPNVQFRSLNKLTDDEIREILGDVDLAKLMDDIEGEG